MLTWSWNFPIEFLLPVSTELSVFELIRNENYRTVVSLPSSQWFFHTFVGGPEELFVILFPTCTHLSAVLNCPLKKMQKMKFNYSANVTIKSVRYGKTYDRTLHEIKNLSYTKDV